jgi:hypothetical protein
MFAQQRLTDRFGSGTVPTTSIRHEYQNFFGISHCYVLFSLPRNPLFDSFFKLSTGQQYAAITAQAAQSNVCTDAVHLPAIIAAGVSFACLDHISNLNVVSVIYILRTLISAVYIFGHC